VRETRAPATELLWQQFADRLRGFIAARVADPDAVEDVLQEVFVRIHRSAGDMRDPDRITGWIFRITRNAIIDHYRSAPRRRETPVDEVTPEAPPQPDDPEDGLAGEVRRELSACVRPLLHQLPPTYREALELVELDGLTQAAAAARVGISVSGMKSRVQRGRARLHRTLADRCEIAVDARGAPLACVPEAGTECRPSAADASTGCPSP
jgi:RNA polymerase sigma-70 factor (ECF subfamily)